MTAATLTLRHTGPASERNWALVLAYLALAYLSVNFGLPALLPSGLNVYVAQPAIWLGLGALCLNLRPELLRRPERPFVLAGVAAGGFQVAVYALAGLIYGFGYSTYAHTAVAVPLNLAYLGCLIWGLETARAFLLREWPERQTPAFFAVSALFAAMTIPVARWDMALAGNLAAFEVSGSSLFPAAAESFLATALALAGGPWASMAYRATFAAAEWFSPVLPDLEPMLVALTGTLAPACAFLALRSVASSPGERAQGTKGVPGWVMVFSVSIVAVIWLNTGLLGVRPALVSGVSMEPNLALGDIVVTRQVDPESLRPGDIIRFRSGEVPVLHRIIEIKRRAEGLFFFTRGDSNNLADGPVPAGLVEGRVFLVIPKLGLIPVKLKSWLAR